MSDFQRLVAEVNASAFIADVDVPKRPRAKREHRLVRAVRALPPRQRELLLELIAGERLLAYLDGAAYAVGGRSDCAWDVAELGGDHSEYVVASDVSSCTCPRSKYNGEECKHMRMLRRFLCE